MTPQEKAKELFEKYKFVYIQNYTSDFEVKECAKIAVDEIIEAVTEIFETYEERNYWHEVKQEIERL